MDMEDIVQETLGNAGGTWAFRNGIHPVEFTEGYMVALAGKEAVYPIDSLDYALNSGFDANKVAAYYSRHANMLGGIGYFLGTWLSRDRVYLDISIHFEGIDSAIAAGLANKQLAIWDCANGTEIVL